MLSILLALPAACTYEEDPALHVAHEPVYGGTVDTAHTAVGGLISKYASGCTATLIGRLTVLSAAHCVCKEYPYETPELPLTFTDSRGQPYDAESVVVAPMIGGSFIDRDVAVVRLKEKVPGIVPSIITTKAPTQGETIILVGRGWGGLSEFPGVTRVGTNTILFVGDNQFSFSNTAGSAICHGDSGGPTYAVRGGKEELIGVHSAGTADKCGAPYGTGYDVRVDAHQAWIVQQAKDDLYAGEPIDTEPPEVSIESPGDGTLVPPSVTVKVQATDNVGVVRVTLKVDGNVEGESTAAPYEFKLTGLTKGSHTMVGEAVDAEENVGTASVTVSLEAGKPFGAECMADAECESGLCRTGRCTEGCSTMKACPEGFECQDLACVGVESSGGGCFISPVSGSAPPTRGLGLALLVLMSLCVGRFRTVRRQDR